MARAAAPTRSAVSKVLARPAQRPGDVELAEMLSRAADGDTNAFADFYDATSPQVYGLVLTVVRSQVDAEQIVGDLYVDVWRHPDILVTGRLTLLTALLCLAHRRAVEGARAAVSANSPPRHTDTGRQRLSLPRSTTLQARQLSPQQQEILVLSYLGGYTVRQVSALLSLPAASVRQALREALLGLAAPRPALLS